MKYRQAAICSNDSESSAKMSLRVGTLTIMYAGQFAQFSLLVVWLYMLVLFRKIYGSRRGNSFKRWRPVLWSHPQRSFPLRNVLLLYGHCGNIINRRDAHYCTLSNDYNPPLYLYYSHLRKV
jgi:hypothetical protein